MWTPTIVVTVAVLGSVDVSSLLTARQFVTQAQCELTVVRFVAAARALYPTLVVASSGCKQKTG
jgi:hypothetical protein